MAKENKKSFWKEFLKFILITTTTLAVICGMIFAFFFFKYNVNTFKLINNINTISSFNEKSHNLDNKFSNNDLLSAQSKLNNANFINNYIYFSDKEVGAIINDNCKSNEIFDNNISLIELTFSNYESTSVLTRLEFVVLVDIADIKINDLTEFPSNIISSSLPDKLYLNFEVDLISNDNNLTDLSIEVKSMTANNLNVSDTANLFNFLNLFSNNFNYKKLSEDFSYILFSQIIGNESVEGIFYKLQKNGAIGFEFKENNNENCLAVYNSNENRTFNITYENTKGATNSNPTSFTPKDSNISLSNLSLNGYNFLGWYDNNDNKVLVINTDSAKNHTLRAKWQTINYSITYNLNGGSVSGSNPTSYNIESENFTIINPTKSGYNFLGWNASHLAQITKDITIQKGTTGNLTLFAVFTKIIDDPTTPQSYSITYQNTKGATNSNPSSFNSNYANITLSNLSLTGYNFLGWKDENNNTISSIDTSSNKNYILTANWQPINYSIYYNLYGGSIHGANRITYNIETDTFTLINPTKAGFNFIGWSGTNIVDKSTSVTIAKGSTGNLIFSAIFEEIVSDPIDPQNYSITYQNTKGATNLNPTSFNSNDSNIYFSSLSLNGYNFLGWYDENDNRIFSINTSSTKNYIITAKWQTINYSIAYNLNGGSVSGSNPTSYNIETSSFTLINPTKAGFNFIGWSGTNIVDKSTSVTIAKGSTGNLTFSAIFEEIVSDENINLTFCVDGINVFTYELTSGASLSKNEIDNIYSLEECGMTGYIVDNWFSDSNLTNQYSYNSPIYTDTIIYGSSHYILNGLLNKELVQRFNYAVNNKTALKINNRNELNSWLFYVMLMKLDNTNIINLDMTSYVAKDLNAIQSEIRAAVTNIQSLTCLQTGGSLSYSARSSYGKYYGYVYTINSELELFATKVFDSNLTQAAAYRQENYLPIKTFDDTRPDSFSNFNLDKISKALTIKTSEQLAFALEQGLNVNCQPGSPAESVLNKAKTVLRNICNEEMSNIDKVYAIYTWLVINVQYDNYAANSTVADKKHYTSWAAEGVFDHKIAVCEGFAKAFLIMARLENIPTIYVTGNGHAWNKVYVNGNWFVLDATHGNTLVSSFIDSKEILTYKNFLITDQQKTNFGYSTTDHSHIKATTVYNYYSSYDININGLEFDLYVDSKSELEELLNNINTLAKLTYNAQTTFSFECVLVSLSTNIISSISVPNLTINSSSTLNNDNGKLTVVYYVTFKNAA